MKATTKKVEDVTNVANPTEKKTVQSYLQKNYSMSKVVRMLIWMKTVILSSVLLEQIFA